MLASTLDCGEIDQAILSQGEFWLQNLPGNQLGRYLVDEMVINILQLSSCVFSFDHTCKKALNDRL